MIKFKKIKSTEVGAVHSGFRTFRRRRFEAADLQPAVSEPGHMVRGRGRFVARRLETGRLDTKLILKSVFAKRDHQIIIVSIMKDFLQVLQ